MKKINTLVLGLTLIYSISSCLAQKIAGGRTFALTVCSDSTVWAWGQNTWGNLGDNTTTQRLTPVQVHGPNNVGFLTGVVAVAGNEYSSLALKGDGSVWAWGGNTYGQLGDNTIIQKRTPVQVHGPNNVGYLTGIIAIAGIGHHWLALKNDSTVWSWGNNGYGQLGINSKGSLNGVGSAVPVQVMGPGGNGFLTGITAIGASYGHNAVLKSDGTVWTWGENGNFQLGDGTQTQQWTPIQVQDSAGTGFLTNIIAITAGDDNCMALTSDSTIWAWGFNSNGGCGINSTVQWVNRPRHVRGPGNVGILDRVTGIFASLTSNFANRDDGTLWGFGSNTHGQIGDSTTVNALVPTQVHGPGNVGFLTDIKDINGGLWYSFAQKNDGSLYLWGYNSNGMLGDGTTAEKWVPVPLNGPCSIAIPPVAGFTADKTTLCAGDYVLFSDTSLNNPTSWSWTFAGGTPSTSTFKNPAVIYSAAGTYAVTLTATNSGGANSTTVSSYVTVTAAPPTPTLTQKFDTLFCSFDPSYTSYQWYAATALIPGATASYLVVSKSGNYNVQVTNANGCSVAVGTNITVGVQDYAYSNMISIYPNPVADKLHVLNYKLHGSVAMNIYNILGEKIFSSLSNGEGRGEAVVDVSSLPAGMYLIRAENNGSKWVSRFIKE